MVGALDEPRSLRVAIELAEIIGYREGVSIRVLDKLERYSTRTDMRANEGR
jgi:hypothetical protein